MAAQTVIQEQSSVLESITPPAVTPYRINKYELYRIVKPLLGTGLSYGKIVRQLNKIGYRATRGGRLYEYHVWNAMSGFRPTAKTGKTTTTKSKWFAEPQITQTPPAIVDMTIKTDATPTTAAGLDVFEAISWTATSTLSVKARTTMLKSLISEL